ncbi:MAG: hypothetical protein ABEL51_12855 [Salinibacter sp.]
MKRTLLAGTFSTLAGVVTLLLLAAIFYSCRSGGNPHNERSSPSHDAPADESHAATFPQTDTAGMRLTLAHAPSVNGRRFDAATAE